MIDIFFSDISEVKTPFVGHLQERAFSLVTKLFKFLVTLDLRHGIWVQSNVVSNV